MLKLKNGVKDNDSGNIFVYFLIYCVFLLKYIFVNVEVN